jgi:glycosyltransferase 2 family protein
MSVNENDNARPMTRPRASAIKIALNLAGWVAGLFFIVFLWQQFARVQADWAQNGTTLNWGIFSLSFILVVIGHAIQSQLGCITQSYLKLSIGRGEMYRLWFFTQIAKYIPGGIWQVAARAVVYQRRGMSLLMGSAATLWEILAILAAALLVGLTSLGTSGRTDWDWLIAIASLLLLAIVIASQMFWFWRMLARLKIKSAERMLRMLAEWGPGRFKMLAQLTLLSLISWLVIGTGFYLLLVAFDSQTTISWWTALVSFLVAWAIGFLIVFVPVGLGVREGAMIILLTPYFGPVNAAAIALLSRLWWALGEGVNIAFAAIWQGVISLRLRSARQPGDVHSA